MKFLPGLVLALAIVATTAVAMGITRHVGIIAWSPDGLSALLNYVEEGPEGGGSKGYGVVTCAGVQGRVTVGSNFSRGGPSRPETISEGACRDALATLGKALAANGFKGFTLAADDCASERRGALIDLEEPRGSPGAFTIVRQGKGLVLNEGKRIVLELPDASSLNVSPTGGAVLVFSQGVGDLRVQELWTRKAGGPFTRCKADVAD